MLLLLLFSWRRQRSRRWPSHRSYPVQRESKWCWRWWRLVEEDGLRVLIVQLSDVAQHVLLGDDAQQAPGDRPNNRLTSDHISSGIVTTLRSGCSSLTQSQQTSDHISSGIVTTLWSGCSSLPQPQQRSDHISGIVTTQWSGCSSLPQSQQWCYKNKWQCTDRNKTHQSHHHAHLHTLPSITPPHPHHTHQSLATPTPSTHQPHTTPTYTPPPPPTHLHTPQPPSHPHITPPPSITPHPHPLNHPPTPQPSPHPDRALTHYVWRVSDAVPVCGTSQQLSPLVSGPWWWWGPEMEDTLGHVYTSCSSFDIWVTCLQSKGIIWIT